MNDYLVEDCNRELISLKKAKEAIQTLIEASCCFGDDSEHIAKLKGSISTLEKREVDIRQVRKAALAEFVC